MRQWIATALSRLLKPEWPTYPDGSASGALTPHVDYLAIFMEGDPYPVVVVVMRFPSAEEALSSSVTGSMRRRGEESPLQFRIESGQRDVTCSLAIASRMLTVQGSQIALGAHNLMLCDISAENQLVPGSLSLATVTYDTDLRGPEADRTLLGVPAVRDFLAHGVT